MTTRMKTWAVTAAALALMIGGAPPGALLAEPNDGQAAAQADARSAKEKARGAVPAEIKVGPDQALKGQAPIAAPDEKSGEKTRQGATCSVTYDNWTADWIDVYADGNYRGRVPPWGELGTRVNQGARRLYASAADNSGTWGPRDITCKTSYTWRLDP